MKNIFLLLILILILGISSTAPFKSVNYIQRSTITSGTLTVSDTGDDIILIHEAGVTLSLTIAMPSTPIDGQTVTIVSTGGVTTVTLTAVSTIVNSITSLLTGGNATYVYSLQQNKWYKIR